MLAFWLVTFNTKSFIMYRLKKNIQYEIWSDREVMIILCKYNNTRNVSSTWYNSDNTDFPCINTVVENMHNHFTWQAFMTLVHKNHVWNAWYRHLLSVLLSLPYSLCTATSAHSQYLTSLHSNRPLLTVPDLCSGRPLLTVSVGEHSLQTT